MREQIIKKWQNKDWDDQVKTSNAKFISEKKIFVIGGSARTGTTLLRVMLDSHSKVLCGPPTNLFVPTKINFDDLAFKYEVPSELLTNMFKEKEDRASFIEKFINLTLGEYNKQLWGDKTARNIYVIPWILKHFPNSRIIHVIRDGRDVVCSLKTHRKRKIVDGKILLTGNIMPIEQCVERWRSSVLTGLSFRSDHRYLEIKYENLINKTKECLLQVCYHLDISFEESMLRYYEFKGPTRNIYKFPQNIEATFPTYTSSIGRWKTDLSEKEVDFVMRELNELLIFLEYI